MFSYQFYKVVHLLGLMLLFISAGGFAIFSALGGFSSDEPKQKGLRKVLFAGHGTALVLLLVAGMGLLARIGVSHGAGWPGWVYAKLVIWLLLGATVALFKRKPGLAKPLFFGVPAVGLVAAYLAVNKPGHTVAPSEPAPKAAAADG